MSVARRIKKQYIQTTEYDAVVEKGGNPALQQHGWTERVLCRVKKFKRRKRNTIGFHLYVELKKTKQNE